MTTTLTTTLEKEEKCSDEENNSLNYFADKIGGEADKINQITKLINANIRETIYKITSAEQIKQNAESTISSRTISKKGLDQECKTLEEANLKLKERLHDLVLDKKAQSDIRSLLMRSISDVKTRIKAKNLCLSLVNETLGEIMLKKLIFTDSKKDKALYAIGSTALVKIISSTCKTLESIAFERPNNLFIKELKDRAQRKKINMKIIIEEKLDSVKKRINYFESEKSSIKFDVNRIKDEVKETNNRILAKMEKLIVMKEDFKSAHRDTTLIQNLKKLALIREANIKQLLCSQLDFSSQNLQEINDSLSKEIYSRQAALITAGLELNESHTSKANAKDMIKDRNNSIDHLRKDVNQLRFLLSNNVLCSINSGFRRERAKLGSSLGNMNALGRCESSWKMDIEEGSHMVRSFDYSNNRRSHITQKTVTLENLESVPHYGIMGQGPIHFETMNSIIFKAPSIMRKKFTVKEFKRREKEGNSLVGRFVENRMNRPETFPCLHSPKARKFKTIDFNMRVEIPYEKFPLENFDVFKLPKITLVILAINILFSLLIDLLQPLGKFLPFRRISKAKAFL